MERISVFVLFNLLLSNGFAQSDVTSTTLVKKSKSLWTIEEVGDIALVWSGHPVGFAFLNYKDSQLIAFYDKDRQMTVGKRSVKVGKLEFAQIPENVGWDSHNSIVMHIDDDEYIHLSGNMHGHPLKYYRTAKPLDISSFEKVDKMVGDYEDRCTYPEFFRGPEKQLVFKYRYGGSGAGNDIYNVYDLKTKTWKRLIDKPLTFGLYKEQEKTMNAYFIGPTLKNDGRFHLFGVWRDTGDCVTNHDLSYARSKDLLHWEKANGDKIELPMTLYNIDVVDPVPIKAGLLNVGNDFSLDSQKRPVIAYHKYDEKGNTQIYTARFEEGRWNIRQITNWNYRWAFGGGGSIIGELHISNTGIYDKGKYQAEYDHSQYGKGKIILDEKTMEPIGLITSEENFKKVELAGVWKDLKYLGDYGEEEVYPVEITAVESKFPGMMVHRAVLGGESHDTKYVFRWETLGPNRDKARMEPLPESSMLKVYKVKHK